MAHVIETVETAWGTFNLPSPASFFGKRWCLACNQAFPLVSMVLSNPTIETEHEAICATLDPVPLCRRCVWVAQCQMLEGKSSDWKPRTPELE